MSRKICGGMIQQGTEAIGNLNDNGSERNNTEAVNLVDLQPDDVLQHTTSNHNEESEDKYKTSLKYLKIVFFGVLLCVATFMCFVTYFFIRFVERRGFETQFQADARVILETFYGSLSYQLGAINSLAISITSFARHFNMTFPNVTIPDYETRVSQTRASADALFITWSPLVTDGTRRGWEEYALQHRFQIDRSFERDTWQRMQQDEFFGFHENSTTNHHQTSQRMSATGNPYINSGANQLADGSKYRPLIWKGAIYNQIKNMGVAEPIGSGPFLPVWQMSPVYPGRQGSINMNMASTKVFQEIELLTEILTSEQAILAPMNLPQKNAQRNITYILMVGQYRHNYKKYFNDPLTFLAYPVFDSLDRNQRKLVGVLFSNLYWKIFFDDVLPTKSKGILCVLESSFNQNFAYQIEGSKAQFIPEEEVNIYKEKYADLVLSEVINSQIDHNSSPKNMAYTSVHLNKDFGQYTLHVYPTQATEDQYLSKRPIVVTGVMAFVFALTSLLFILYDYFYERRQNLVATSALENAHRAAMTEREMNEYISHEVRSPLSAAMTASHFVSSALVMIIAAEQDGMDKKKHNNCKSSQKIPCLEDIKNDVDIIQSSLQYVDSLLRGMLDLHIAEGNELKLHLTPTDIMIDVFEPVLSMVYTRDEKFELQLDCCGTGYSTNQVSRKFGRSKSLTVMSDLLRLKQIVLNLVKNSARFVKRGFIRLRADVVDGNVVLYIEDSGPGIAPEEKATLFTKFKGVSRLDMLRQGTGIGLCLSNKLMQVMKGNLWLDESYDSGMEDCPGCRFVVQLNTPPLNFDDSEIQDPTETPPEPAPPLSSVELSLPENISVLFVDDDLVLRKLFCRVIRAVAPSWFVQQASTGEMALKLVTNTVGGKDDCTNDIHTFDVIFMDQYMPNTERQLLGTETTRIMRSKGVNSIICGLSANDMSEAFLEAGANFFLLKPLPCKKEELKQVLIGLLQEKVC